MNEKPEADVPHVSDAELAVRAALNAAKDWKTTDALWRACPGVKRRVVSHHLARLTEAGEVERRTLIDTPGGSRIVERTIWCTIPVVPLWYDHFQRVAGGAEPDQGSPAPVVR